MRFRQRSRYRISTDASAPFSPSDIAGLALWVDASDGATILNTTGSVDTWLDKSSEGNDLTATGGVRPTTSIRTVNSLNALDFDGSDRFACPAALLDVGQSANTWFFVYASDNTGDTVQSLLHGTNSGGGLRHSIQFDTTQILVQNRSTSSSTTAQALVRDTTQHVIGFRRTGTSITPFVDGTNGTAGTNAENTAITTMGIGANAAISANRFNGALCEVLAYRSALSDTDWNNVGNYLKDKWSVVWSIAFIASLNFSQAANSMYMGVL